MSEASVKIESQDLSIESLYKDFYTVPDFQREYVWQREQVEKLLQDVHDEFYDEEGQLIKGPEYFLGSIVVCKGNGGTFQLIDGQQRMTTIYLILCGIRDLLIEMNESPNDTLKAQLSSAATDDDGEEIFRHRLVLQYEDSKGILEQIVKRPGQLDNISERTISVERIRTAYQDIKEFLRVNCNTSPKRLRRFYAAFTKRVKLIRIKTPSLTNALKVFETINDRGVGLNAMDLLKSLLFMKTTSDDYPKLKERWKKLIDTVNGCGEKPLRFLRYYIMSQFELDSKKPLREDDIYDWFVKNTKLCGLEDNPLAFLKELIECAKAWSKSLRDTQDEARLAAFLKEKIVRDLGTRSPAFDFAFAELSQSRIQKYRMRYILAKLTQHIEQEAWNNPAHKSLDQYIASTVDTEHILPQSPTPLVKETFDKKDQYDEFVEKLGNLTLLEKTINTSVSNEAYDKKLPGYQQSAFLLTKSLVEKPQIGVNTSLNRAVRDLQSFSEWNSESIASRQNMLATLARSVWSTPESNSSEKGEE